MLTFWNQSVTKSECSLCTQLVILWGTVLGNRFNANFEAN
jgi:hypothetical protein